MDTIFALASAQGKAGVAVVRISGPEAWEVAGRYCALPEPRHASVRVLRSGDGEALDEALVLTFAEGGSFTGEPSVEFHVHGSQAVVRALLTSLAEEPEARLADAGEFTRRALDHGRMDLTQVEGLGDLLAAETEAQRKLALRGLSGALKDRAEGWRSKLLRAAALLEATIDFADEDIPEDVTGEVQSLMAEVATEISDELAGFEAARQIRNGFEVAILGPPNAGKSTLLNALAGRDAALTSDIAGTTRDVVEVRMDLAGIPVTFLDTAGIRDTKDLLEKMGVDRAQTRARDADLRLFVSSSPEDLGLVAEQGDILVTGKGDLFPDAVFPVSGQTHLGLEKLIRDITSELSGRVQSAGLVGHERQKTALSRAEQDLARSVEVVSLGSETYDIAAEELRSATRALAQLIGRIDVETVLGEIFSEFCVGK